MNKIPDNAMADFHLDHEPKLDLKFYSLCNFGYTQTKKNKQPGVNPDFCG
jgi:hypothetical protein